MPFRKWFTTTYPPGAERTTAARALAKKCGVKQGNVNHWINGTRTVPLHYYPQIEQFSADKVTARDLLKAAA